MLKLKQAISIAKDYYSNVCDLSSAHTFIIEETELKENHWLITLCNSDKKRKVFKIISEGPKEGDVVYMKEKL
jgi:hypothetical protein